MKRISGFTIIELLIVIAVIGILAAIAIPFYKIYTIKAKMTEVTNAMSAIASAINAYRQEDQDNWPTADSVAAIQNSLGVNVPTGRLNDPEAGMVISSVTNGVEIIATIGNIDESINGKKLVLRGTQTEIGGVWSPIMWIWSWDPDFPTYFRPKN
jgi:type IV pilus assembly protein PilA